MSGRGNQKYPGQQLDLARHLLEAAGFDEFGKRVVRRVAGGAEFGRLHEDRDRPSDGLPPQ